MELLMIFIVAGWDWIQVFIAVILSAANDNIHRWRYCAGNVSCTVSQILFPSGVNWNITVRMADKPLFRIDKGHPEQQQGSEIKPICHVPLAPQIRTL